MGLIRLIIIIFIGWLLFRLFRHWQNQLTSKPKSPGEKIDTMVKCAQCGVHVPEKSAIESDGLFFCCEEHKNDFSS